MTQQIRLIVLILRPYTVTQKTRNTPRHTLFISTAFSAFFYVSFSRWPNCTLCNKPCRKFAITSLMRFPNCIYERRALSPSLCACVFTACLYVQLRFHFDCVVFEYKQSQLDLLLLFSARHFLSISILSVTKCCRIRCQIM